MVQAIDSKMVKGRGQTIFVDLKEAKNGAMYVTLNSLGRDQNGDKERRTIRVFGEQINNLSKTLGELVKDNSLHKIKDEPVAKK